jgi:RimJ/RimL family protein N-acetyltransferase
MAVVLLFHPAVSFLAKDSRLCLLRPARSGDGAGIVEAMDRVAAEGIYIATEQVRWTPAETEEIIASMNSSPFILVAAVDGTVVGHAFLQRGTLRKNRHTAGLGMLIVEGYRNIGIGTRMMEYTLEWAKREGLRKLYLSLFSTNIRAYNLYRKVGFIEEGRRREQFRLRGEPVDEILMGLLLPEADNDAAIWEDFAGTTAKQYPGMQSPQ